MKTLYLGDLSNYTEKEIKEHIRRNYYTESEPLKKFKILVAYEHEDSYDGSSFFLLKDKTSGELYENHASHCSCYGYEGQWFPEKTSLEYLKSNHFSCYNGEESVIKEFIEKMK